VLFFVAIGMLFNPFSLIENPLPIVATLFIILIGKSLAAFLIVLAFRHPIRTALIISASLAQIGEFSFILAELGVRLGLLPEEGRDLILAGAILSICLNPLAFVAIDWLTGYLERRWPYEPRTSEPTAAPVGTPVAEPLTNRPPIMTELTDHIVLVGYGRVGSLVGQFLQGRGQAFLVIEAADRVVATLREAGIEAILGNAANADILRSANLAAASRLIVAIPEAFEAGQVVQQGRAANPGLEIVARAHSDAEVEHLTGLGADVVIMGEREIARSMIEEISRRFAPAPDQASVSPA
jgi:CPA2 family monovalent cation:H+ antiporter-2